MEYGIGSEVYVKCAKDWKVGIIENIVNGWLFIKVDGLKTYKRVHSDWVNMYF